ncbi:SDR family oxidoreductase [bacterium]|nr:SDR family oxidoreductase [bacterium]
MNAKRVLLTGGAGFIGSHLTGELLKLGHQVTVLDNLSSGRLENIQEFEGCESFRFIKHDVSEPFCEDFDWIFNLACPASPDAYQTDPIQTTKTSMLGAFNMLGLAKRCGARLLQASTSEVYGDPKVHPQVESYWGNVNPVGVRSCYDEGKRVAETLCNDYRRQNGVDTKIIRIFNTYGPRMRVNDGRVVSNFIVQALQDKDITVYGDGSQTRSFCYVKDLVRGILAMMTKDSFPGPVNLGNPGEYKVRDLAEIIIKMTNSKSRIINLPLPSDDPTVRRPDISLAKKELHWEPKIDLNEGLLLTIAYFDKELTKRVIK